MYYRKSICHSVMSILFKQYNLKCSVIASDGYSKCLDKMVMKISKSNWRLNVHKHDAFSIISFYPSAPRAGGVLSSWSGRAGGWVGGCQTCGTHISVTACRIFSIRSSVESSRPVGVHCHGHMPICPIRACPWAKNLATNWPQIGSRLCGMHMSETAGWIYPI